MKHLRWCRDAVDLWPALADELRELTNVDVDLRQPGGFWIGFNETEMEMRAAMLERIKSAGADVPYEMLDHAALKSRLPAIGPRDLPRNS